MKTCQSIVTAMLFILVPAFIYAQGNEKNSTEANNTITKGTKTLGGGATLFFETRNSVDQLSFNVSPGYGKFLTDRFLLQGSLYLGTFQQWRIGSTQQMAINNFGAGASGRYYFGVEQRHAFYATASAGIISENIYNKDITVQKSYMNNLMFNAGPGYCYFITPYLSLDATLLYTRNLSFDHVLQNNYGNLTLNFGVSWYISKACR